MRPISALFALSAFVGSFVAAAQQNGATLESDLRRLVETPAVTGYEGPVIAAIEKELTPFHPVRDALGNLTVTFGTGAPHRLIAAPVDEPGYVVSAIQPDGYARLQRLPQSGMPAHWNELNNAQPMLVEARDGTLHSAITAGLSIHLEPGRADVPNADDIDHLYLDLGARGADEARGAGIDVLSPVAAERHLLRVGNTQWSGTAVGDRYAAAVLLQLARALGKGALTKQGTTTIAFVVQQWAGSRGLTRMVEALHPDELLYLGRIRPVAPRGAGATPALPERDTNPEPALGAGIVASSAGADASPDALAKEFSSKETRQAAPVLVRGYGPAVPLPAPAIPLSVPLLYPLTAGETLHERDVQALLVLLGMHVGAAVPVHAVVAAQPMPYAAPTARFSNAPTPETALQALVEGYGVSEQERMTRETVERLLPAWAHPETDSGGNLVLRLGAANKAASSKQPEGIVFMAHTDELGFRIRAINANGTLELDNKGGGSPAFFWGHPALVHTGTGMRGGVVTLPENWESPQFKFPGDFRIAAKLYVGASSLQQVEALGIKAGDQVTIPKRYRPLLGDTISARSLDDRVGCAAMVRAVWELGPDTKRDVTFVWSTREELGLLGAGEFAAASNKANRTPATVFAIDTFVSSDSPIESHRFADAPIGSGFVVRAIDNSNIAAWPLVQRVEALAKKHNIPVQYGITGGGNDGATFQRYGSADVPLSWPLRYSHSPGEVIDTRDLDALSSIVTVLAREW